MRLPDLRERSRPWIAQVDQPLRRAPDSGQPRHQMGGVRRAAAYDDVRLESPDHGPRAQRRSKDPAVALVRKSQERGDLIAKLAQQTAWPAGGRNARYVAGQPERFPEDQPAEQPVAVAQGPERRTPLHVRPDRRGTPARRSSRDD